MVGQKMSNIRIMINPGHDCSIGSNGMPVDSGAVNDEYDVYECDIAANVGMMVADYLKAAGGYDVFVMQQDNLAGEYSYSYTYSVVGQANLNKMDYFVSIHCNSFTNSAANGTETCIYEYGGEAERLANSIQNEICNTLNTTDRGLKIRKDLCVLSKTRMPAVLVELAFISNEDDVQLLINNQEDFAAAVARGITNYIGMMGD